MDFEKTLKRLEEIMAALEKGNLSLEEGTTLFEEAVELQKNCYKTLGEMKGKVTVLKKQLDKLVEDDLNFNEE